MRNICDIFYIKFVKDMARVKATQRVIKKKFTPVSKKSKKITAKRAVLKAREMKKAAVRTVKGSKAVAKVVVKKVVPE